jgi:hypothetical protein
LRVRNETTASECQLKAEAERADRNSDHREAHDHLEQRGEVKAAGALRGPSVAARLHHF